MLKPKNVVVVSPHADDEVLGCGAWLARLHEQGADLTGVLLSCSDVDLHQGKPGDVRQVGGLTRKSEYRTVAAKLGMQTEIARDFTTRFLQMDVPGMIRYLEVLFQSVEPDTVLFPGRSFHQDHRAVYEAVMAALRPRNCPSVRAVVTYEISNYTWQHEGEEFLPNYYVTFNRHELERKQRLAAIYESQNLHTPAGQYEIESQATRRGLELRPLPAIDDENPEGSLPYAEAYRILRLEDR